MSDLDKAIRAELETAYWRLSRQTSTAADKGARAVLSVLDLHTHSDVDGVRTTTGPMRQCAACGLVSRDRWCDTVNAIADDLGVSGEDRSEPTPAPRAWPFPVERDSRGRFWTEREGEMWTVYREQPFVLHGPPEPRREVEELYGPLVPEVVSPEGTS